MTVYIISSIYDSVTVVVHSLSVIFVLQSMGESLSFEESVLEVIETARNIQCGNDLCKANQNRLSHELDMAMCRLNMIHASLRK